MDVKFVLSHGPTVVVVKGTSLNGSANTDLVVFKNAQGQIVYSVTAGFRPPWGENFEILRLSPKSGSVVIKTLDSTGADLVVATIASGSPLLSSLKFSGSEIVKFEATAEFQMLIRALPKDNL